MMKGGKEETSWPISGSAKTQTQRTATRHLWRPSQRPPRISALLLLHRRHGRCLDHSPPM